MLCIATSGPLGRFVELPVPVTTGIRGIIAFILLFLFCKFRKVSLSVMKKDIPVILLTGVLMTSHWLFYFYALQWSNVAIGMLSLFTYPVITAFMEPLILKSKLQRMHLVLGILVLLGIYFLSPNFDLKDSNTLAILMGLISAISYSLRNIILKLKVEKYQGTTLMVYQTATIGILMMPALFFIPADQILGQWEGLLALGVITTAIGHSLFLMTFKHFSITTVSILSSVQPIYGIVLGAIFLQEIPRATTLFGGLLILSSVVIESFRASKKQQISSEN